MPKSSTKKSLNVTMIDNYDSFTYNLVQYLQELHFNVTVHRNDEISAEEVIAGKPHFLVLSPGPSTPSNAGISLKLIEKCADKGVPLLGVCLGHQAIGEAFGGKVVRAKTPIHGKTSHIQHFDQGLFRGLPNPLKVTRYHSLIVERKSLPSCLEVTAELNDGTIMGLRHKSKPIEGVQFHPESILTEQGRQMLANFASSL